MEEEIIEEPEPWYKCPIKWIIGIFLLLIIVIWVFPAYSVKIDPEPHDIPTIKDVVPDLVVNETVHSMNTRFDILNFVEVDPDIKYVADRISVLSCDGNRICQAKAVF